MPMYGSMKLSVALLMWLFVRAFPAQGENLPSKIILGTNEMRPWVARDLPEYGIISRIVIRAFAKAQMQSEVVWVPWKRLFNRTIDSRIAAAYPMGVSEERLKLFHYSDAIFHLDRVACHLKSKGFTWKTIEDFRGKTIAFKRGAYFGELYKQLKERNLVTFVELDSDLAMMKMLLAHRIDLFFCQERETNENMQRLVEVGQLTIAESEAIGTSGRSILSAPLFVGFPRFFKDGSENMLGTQIRDRFNRGLALLRKDEPGLFPSAVH